MVPAKPKLTLDPPSNILAVNQSSYEIKGQCSFESEAINLSGDVTGTAICSGGNYTFSVDASALSDGTVNLSLAHSHPLGLNAQAISFSVDKQTSVPAFTSLVLNLTPNYINHAKEQEQQLKLQIPCLLQVIQQISMLLLSQVGPVTQV